MSAQTETNTHNYIQNLYAQIAYQKDIIEAQKTLMADAEANLNRLLDAANRQETNIGQARSELEYYKNIVAQNTDYLESIVWLTRNLESAD